MRVVTWNVRRFRSAEGKCTVDAIAQALAKLNPRPDVIGLNEVDAKHSPDALHVIAEKLGNHGKARERERAVNERRGDEEERGEERREEERRVEEMKCEEMR